MSEIITVQDLETLKKHEIFEAEVITGKVGGLAGGATIPTATNQVTGQVQTTLPETIAGMNAEFDAMLAGMGYSRVGTFKIGYTLENTKQTLLWALADGGDGQEYGWTGAFPKIVPPDSTPASTGGIAAGAWLSRFDPDLRNALVSFSGSIAATPDWSDVPAHSDPEMGPALDTQAQALVARSEQLRLEQQATSVVDLKRFGIVDGGVITQAQIAAASLYCHQNRRTGWLNGAYTMEENIVIDFNFDGTDCQITTDNTVIVGRDTNFVRDGITVICPRMIAKTIRPTGFESVGVRLRSLTNSFITVPYVKGFTKCFQVLAHGAPVVFNTVTLGKLDDGYINFAIETMIYEPDPAYISFANENLFIGGNLSMSPQAVSDPNRAQIYGRNRDAGINGNYWLKTCVEFPTYGAGQPGDRYLRFASGCSENFLIGLRPEGIGKFTFEDNSSNNTLTFGSQSTVYNVTIEEITGAADNRVDRMGKNGEARGLANPIVLSNTLNEDRSIMDFVAPLGAGGVHNRTGGETTYSTRFIHDGVSYKRTDDTADRVVISARSKTGLDVSRGVGTASAVSNTFSCATRVTATGTDFVFDPLSIAQSLSKSASGVNVVSAEVVGYRASDGKKFAGRFLAVVKYDPAVSADYSVIHETFTTTVNDFTGAVLFSLGNGVGKGRVISPRVRVTDTVTTILVVEAQITMSSSNLMAN